MKDIFKIAELISKEKVGELTDEERMLLNDWKANGEVEQAAYFYSSDSNRIQKKHDLYKSLDKDKAWKRITEQVPDIVRPIVNLRNVLKWAALFLLPLLASTYLLNEVYRNDNQVFVKAGSSKATLQLSNGKTICLENFQGRDIKVGKRKLASNKHSNLIYQPGESVEEDLVYNTIRTPVQGEYSMVLSDGSKVYLNAQTSLVFPVEFGSGKRELILKEGEACFEVSKDAKRPFIVHLSNGSEVEVLGTVFNVMAYADEEEIQTTLLEGKVQFAYGEAKVLLAPGEQSGLNRENNKISVRDVKASEFFAWREGKFVFNREPLGSVFRKMSRWYGVEINCEDGNLLNRRISGVINRYEDIDKLIHLIEEVSPVKIDLDEKRIIISRK